MTKIKRRWERLSDEERKLAKDDLILFFENERDQKIGIIAAEEILNFFYNQWEANSTIKELMMQKKHSKIVLKNSSTI